MEKLNSMFVAVQDSSGGRYCVYKEDVVTQLRMRVSEGHPNYIDALGFIRRIPRDERFE